VLDGDSLSTIEEIQRLSASIKQKEQEYREADRKFQLEHQARLQRIQEMKGQLAELSDKLIEEPTTGWSDETGHPSSPSTDGDSDTKCDQLKGLYSDNPKVSVKELALAIYGKRDTTSQKRIYALRDYLFKRGELKKEDGGRWSVSK
jgi:hypothetical protein